MKTVIQLQGLDCAGCAAELEEIVKKIEGVSTALLAFVTQKLTVEYDGDETLEKIFYAVNHFEDVSVAETGENAPNGVIKRIRTFTVTATEEDGIYE